MKNTNFLKTISGIILSASLALFYAHQEVEIVKESFRIDKNRRYVTLLLDQYRSLVYNLSRLESPNRIEETLCVNEIVLCAPESGNIRRFEENNPTYASKKESVKESFLAKIFDRFSAKAEAKVYE